MTMNDEIKRHLGQGNCGPIEFSEHEQLAIAKQIIAERIRQSGLIPRELSQLDPLSCLYGDANRYCDPDIIKSFARHQDLSLEAATGKLAKRLGTSCDAIFGTNLSSAKHNGPPQRLAGTQYLALQSAVNCFRTFPSTLYLHEKAWQLSTILQYSASDGDFVAGEAIYSDQDTGEYFALNVYADKIRNDVERPDKELHLGYQHKQYRLLNENLMLNKPELPVFIFHDKRIAGLLLEMDDLPFVPSTFGGRYDDISDVCLEPLMGKTVNIVPLASKKSYQSLTNQAEAFVKAGAKKVFIANIPLLLHPKKTSAEEQSTISDRLIRHIVIKSQVIGANGELGFDLTNHRSLPAQFKTWAHEYGLSSASSSENSERESISSLLAKSSVSPSEHRLEDILSREYLSGIFGDTHSGKTLVACTLAVSLACGVNVFDFSSHYKRHILYIHAEASGVKAAAIIKQIASGYTCRQEDLDTYFHLWSTKDRPLGSLKKEGEGKRQLERKIEETEAKLIIFDNLLSLIPEAVDSSHHWNDLYSWFQELSKNYGTAVLFLHHLNKDGDTSGLQRIKHMTNNIITLSKKDNSFQGKKGCLTSLRIQKNKAYQSLDGFDVTYFLEAHATPEAGTPWLKAENDPPASCNNTIIPTFTYNDSLSPEENTILKYIFEQGEANRKDIEKLLGCGAGTARNRMDRLLVEQYIEKIGSARATRYVLRERTVDVESGQPQPTALSESSTLPD